MASEPSSIREVGKRTSWVSKPRIFVMNGSPWVQYRSYRAAHTGRLIPGGSFGGGLAADQPGQEQGDQDDRAVDGLDPVVRRVGQVENVLHQPEEDEAGRRPAHVAPAALQA